MGSIVATAALWGASTPLVKELVDTVPPCTLAALRMAIAVVVLLPVLM
jgi:drug/metabolite transporter (DMT)-like permease